MHHAEHSRTACLAPSNAPGNKARRASCRAREPSTNPLGAGPGRCESRQVVEIGFMKDFVLYVSLATGLLSAVFWTISAYVKVKPGPEVPDENGMYDVRLIIDGADIEPTMRKQSIWNSRAAIAAALTAVLQVAYNAWPSAMC